MNEIPHEKIGDHVTLFLRGNTWYVNFQIAGKQKRQSLKTTSKKQARVLAIRLAAELSEGRYAEAKKVPTVKSVADRYIAHLRAERRRPKTLAKIELVVRRVLDLAARRDTKSILDVSLQ